MSTAGALGGSREWRGPAGARAAARVPEAGLIACLPGAHGPRPTAVDERSRRLSHEELAVATLLAGEGHRVRSLPERPGSGPIADLEVCGTPVEVKSFLSLPDRAGRVPTTRSVCNKLLGARAQAPTVVLFTQGSGLRQEVARGGVAEFAAQGRPGRITAVRVVGDGFDLEFSPRQLRELAATASVAPDAARYRHPARPVERRGLGDAGLGG